MATITQKFHFLGDTAGWSPTTSDSHVIASYREPHRDYGRRANGIAETMGGCLRITYMDCPASTNKWELSTTWEALGVPAGHTVTSVTADYQYRWDLGRDFSHTITANANKIGPLELRDSSSSLIGTISTANTMPTTGFAGSSSGSHSSHYPTAGPMTGTRTDDLNHGWANCTGSAVAVSGGTAASSATVKFRLNHIGQAVPRAGRQFVRVRIDRVVLNITHGVVSTRRIFII